MERFEDALLILLPNPDARVGDADDEFAGGVPRVQSHLSDISELNRIRHHIVHNLFQADLVSYRFIRKVCVNCNRQSLAGGFVLPEASSLFDQAAQREGSTL